MSNLKLECLKLAVEYWKGHNITLDHMKETADSIYDYCKEGESDIGMNVFERAEFERKCSGDWSPSITVESEPPKAGFKTIPKRKV
jgi:hypothetical protein